MNERTKVKLSLVIVVLVGAFGPAILYFAFHREVDLTILAMGLALSGPIAILGGIDALRRIRKAYGRDWANARPQIPAEVRKSTFVRASIFSGLSMAIVGLVYGIIIQNNMVILFLVSTGMLIGWPAGDRITKHLPVQGTLYNLHV